MDDLNIYRELKREQLRRKRLAEAQNHPQDIAQQSNPQNVNTQSNISGTNEQENVNINQFESSLQPIETPANSAMEQMTENDVPFVKNISALNKYLIAQTGEYSLDDTQFELNNFAADEQLPNDELLNDNFDEFADAQQNDIQTQEAQNVQTVATGNALSLKEQKRLQKEQLKEQKAQQKLMHEQQKQAIAQQKQMQEQQRQMQQQQLQQRNLNNQHARYSNLEEMNNGMIESVKDSNRWKKRIKITAAILLVLILALIGTVMFMTTRYNRTMVLTIDEGYATYINGVEGGGIEFKDPVKSNGSYVFNFKLAINLPLTGTYTLTYSVSATNDDTIQINLLPSRYGLENNVMTIPNTTANTVAEVLAGLEVKTEKLKDIAIKLDIRIAYSDQLE